MENEIVKAVEIIKTAILNSQYEAVKDVNRVQLGLYFGIGRFLASSLLSKLVLTIPYMPFPRVTKEIRIKGSKSIIC